METSKLPADQEATAPRNAESDGKGSGCQYEQPCGMKARVQLHDY
jgi:hypothetical protein